MAAKDIEAAVRAWQLYGGCQAKVRIRDEQKLFQRAVKLSASVAKKRGMEIHDAERQLSDEARRRGYICPLPGKDI